MAELDEDIEFSRLLAEKQHREMLSALKSLSYALEKMQGKDSAVKDAIATQANELSRLVDQIKSIPPPVYNSPEITIDQQGIITELKNLQSEFRKIAELLATKKPVEYEFKIERGYGNNIEKIIAKPK